MQRRDQNFCCYQSEFQHSESILLFFYVSVHQPQEPMLSRTCRSSLRPSAKRQIPFLKPKVCSPLVLCKCRSAFCPFRHALQRSLVQFPNSFHRHTVNIQMIPVNQTGLIRGFSSCLWPLVRADDDNDDGRVTHWAAPLSASLPLVQFNAVYLRKASVFFLLWKASATLAANTSGSSAANRSRTRGIQYWDGRLTRLPAWQDLTVSRYMPSQVKCFRKETKRKQFHLWCVVCCNNRCRCYFWFSTRFAWDGSIIRNILPTFVCGSFLFVQTLWRCRPHKEYTILQQL